MIEIAGSNIERSCEKAEPVEEPDASIVPLVGSLFNDCGAACRRADTEWGELPEANANYPAETL
jgi:hypothetical protein